MSDFVRVRLENGAEASVPAGHATAHSLEVIEGEPAVDGLNVRAQTYPDETAVEPASPLDDMSIEQLRAEIDARNAVRADDDQLSKKGSKAELAERIKIADSVSDAAPAETHQEGQ